MIEASQLTTQHQHHYWLTQTRADSIYSLTIGPYNYGYQYPLHLKALLTTKFRTTINSYYKNVAKDIMSSSNFLMAKSSLVMFPVSATVTHLLQNL